MTYQAANNFPRTLVVNELACTTSLPHPRKAILPELVHYETGSVWKVLNRHTGERKREREKERERKREKERKREREKERKREREKERKRERWR